MSPSRLAVTLALAASLTAVAQERQLANQERKFASTDAKRPGVGAAMEAMIAQNDIAGAVTAEEVSSN